MGDKYFEGEQYGEYVMRLSEDTVWINSGNRTASDPADLMEGEGLYVFHSPIATRSMPPQSAAFAVVCNVSQDASCARYHKVEAVEKTEEGAFRITTDNGGLFFLADDKTDLSAYEGEASEGQLGPQDAVTAVEAERMMQELSK